MKYDVCTVCNHAQALHDRGPCRHSLRWRGCTCRAYVRPVDKPVPVEIQYRETASGISFWDGPSS